MRQERINIGILKFILVTLVSFLLFISPPVLSSPEEDLKEIRNHFSDVFPNTPFKEFNNGVYSIHAPSREQWESIEEFPPYEINIDNGEKLFNTPFKNGNSYASCFENDGIGIRQNFPYFDDKYKMCCSGPSNLESL